MRVPADGVVCGIDPPLFPRAGREETRLDLPGPLWRRVGVTGARGSPNGHSRTRLRTGHEESWELICECDDLACCALLTLMLVEYDGCRGRKPPMPILAPPRRGRLIPSG